MSRLALLGAGLTGSGIGPGYDVVVLAGQSNMIGRYGPVDGTLDATNARILQYGFDGQSVVLASDPLDHVNETADTVGLGISFAKALLPSVPSNRQIVLVPTAQGATALSDGFWLDGGSGYESALTRANAAMAAGDGENRLIAILWHQGERDVNLGVVDEAVHAANLDALIAGWRAQMTGADETTPFIVGDLVQGWNVPNSNGVRAALANTPARTKYTAFVESTSLVDGGDGLHFSAASQRTFGARYHTALASAQANAPTLPAAIDDLAVAAGTAALTWTAPEANGAITDYLIEYKESSSDTWLTYADGTSTSTSASLSLSFGTSYDYRVSAINGAGTAPASNVVTSTPVDAIAVVQEFESYLASSTTEGATTPVSFPSTPSEGQMIVIIRHRPNISSGAPAGFTTQHGGSDPLDPYVFTKIAGASETNSYPFTSSLSTNIFTVGIVLSGAASVSVVRVADDASDTSLQIPASGQSFSDGDAIVVVRAAGVAPGGNPQGVGAQSYDAGWTLISKDLEETDGMLLVIGKECTSDETGQTVTNTWTDSRTNRRGLWLRFT